MKKELCVKLVIYKGYTEKHGQQNIKFYKALSCMLKYRLINGGQDKPHMYNTILSHVLVTIVVVETQQCILWFRCWNFHIYIYIYIYILRGFKTSDDAFRLSYSIAFDYSICSFLDLFHSSLYIFHLSRFSGDGLVFSLPSGFQWIIIFSNRFGSILSTIYKNTEYWTTMSM